MLVLLNVTRSCNLACTYCMADAGGSGNFLSVADCILLRRNLPDVLAPGEQVTYLWHGGEPTLLPADTFCAMQEILSDLPGHECRVTMQTNGWHLPTPWLEALQKFSVHPGVSVDGPENLHDQARKTLQGTGSYQSVQRTIARMKETGLPVALLCTVRKEHVGREAELLDWLEEMDVPLRCNPLLGLGRSREALAPADYALFLRNLCQESLLRDTMLRIEPLQWMILAVLRHIPPTECSFSGKCGQKIMALNPGGGISLCNRRPTLMGTLQESSLQEILATDGWCRAKKRVENLRRVCTDCSIWDFCHGGCQAAGEPAPDLCEARRDFFAWLQKEGLMLLRQALIRRRSAIRREMHVLQTEKKRFRGSHV